MGYNSHAELGLTGDNNFHLKTSLDGSHFKDSLIADAHTGAASFPNGIDVGNGVSSVEGSGGLDHNYGLPSLSVTYYGRSNLTLIANRVYFSPFYVDRPTIFKGGFIAQYAASPTAGAIIRAGIFKLGAANGDSWDIGERVADFGTQPADVAGHKDFETGVPSTLEAGWYVLAIGTNGSGVGVRYLRTLQTGQAHFVKAGSSTAADIRFSGAANYLYRNNAGNEIEDGFSQTWPLNPVIDYMSVYPFGYCPCIPKWQRWDS